MCKKVKGVILHGKEKEEEEIVGMQFGALPIDQLVSPAPNRAGFFYG